jgi:hypothetical protein
MAQSLTHRDNHCHCAHYLTERQEDVVAEALRQLDCNGDRSDALENDTWLCVTTEPREGH